MIPQLPAVAHFIKFGDAYPVFVGRHMFGDDVHSNLAQKQVGTDAGRCRNAGFRQHITDHRDCQIVYAFAVERKIVGGIDEHLIA